MAITTKSDLPDGFVVNKDAGSAAGGSGSADLPEGFQVREDAARPAAGEKKGAQANERAEPKEGGSLLNYDVDKLKEGFAEWGATPALLTDAMQVGLDQAANVANKVRKVGQGMGLVPIGTPEEEAKKQWYLGNKPDAENLGGYKQAKKGIQALLRSDQLVQGKDPFKEVEIPKDSFGGPSRAAEIQGRMLEYVGADLMPGAGAVATSGRKLITAVTMAAGDSLSGLSSVELKHQFGNWAPKFGFTREQGEALGDQIGGFLGPKSVAYVGAGVAKASAKAVEMNPNKGRPWQTYLPWTDQAKEYQKQEAAVNVNKSILEAYQSNPTNAENVAELARLQKKMSNFKPGVAGATNDPALIMMTKQVSQATPEGLIEANKVAARNAKAIGEFKEAKFPNERPVDINQGARAKAGTDKGIVQAQLNNTQRQLTEMGDALSRTVDKTKIGEDLRELYFSKKEAVKKVLDAQLDDVYAQGDQMKLKIGMTQVRTAVEGIVNSDKETFQEMPGSFRKILTEYKKPPPVDPATAARAAGSTTPRPPVQPETPTASLREVHSLYKEVNRDWANLVLTGSTVPGNLDKARKLSIVKDQLKQTLDRFATPEYGELGKKFTEYNQNYTKYSTTFKQGAGGEIGKRTTRGYSTDAETLVDKVFLKSGDKAKGMNDFMDIYGGDERAAGLLHDGIWDNFKRAAVDPQGNFSKVGADRWLKNNARAMDAVPELKKELESQRDLGGALLDRQKELYAQRKVLDKTVMAKVAGAQNPELLISAGMKDPNLFRALLASAKTPDNRESLARAIVDHVTQKEKDPYQFLTHNEKALKPVMDALGKDHWENLQTLAKAQEIADRTKPPTSVTMTSPQDPASALIGTSSRSMVSMYRAMATGRGSKVDSMVAIAGNLAFKVRNDQMKALMQASLFDPDLAKVLSKIETGAKAGIPPTKSQLLDLKAIGYANGVMIGTNIIGTQAKLQQDQRKHPDEQHTDYDEGEGKWRRKKSSVMY